MIRLLTGLNEALYEVVVYLVLLPKTLVKVIIAPKWISPYIEAELRKDASERFNEYAATRRLYKRERCTQAAAALCLRIRGFLLPAYRPLALA
jgi:uncharacterized protein YfeS